LVCLYLLAGQDVACRLDITNTGTLLLKNVLVPMSPGVSSATPCDFPALAPSATSRCTLLWRATQQDFDNWDEQYEEMASGMMVRSVEVYGVASAMPALTAHAADEVTVPLTARPALSVNITRVLAPIRGSFYDPMCCDVSSGSAPGGPCYCQLCNKQDASCNRAPWNQWRRSMEGTSNFVLVPGG
jgi:hypothetical protein